MYIRLHLSAAIAGTGKVHIRGAEKAGWFGEDDPQRVERAPQVREVCCLPHRETGETILK